MNCYQSQINARSAHTSLLKKLVRSRQICITCSHGSTAASVTVIGGGDCIGLTLTPNEFVTMQRQAAPAAMA